jgi:L-ascorbate metabolism protein UlaG (beta-lactamase superfamily)
MVIRKYLHSCLLLEVAGKTVLFDPGNFTYEAKVFPLETLSSLDYVLITHEHPDHFHLPFLQEILQKFPDITIISNQAVVDLLAIQNISASTAENDFIFMDAVPHELLWDKKPPMNTKFDLFETFTHPGDSHHFASSTAILALPLQAPWGSTAEAVALALRLAPKHIIPIHDWHWREEVRMGMYTRLKTFFAKQNIIFHSAETGVAIHI